MYFYPRSPCGERRSAVRARAAALAISIHALLAESDVRFGIFCIWITLFLSTLSLRRATKFLITKTAVIITPHHNFYPRSPCGERQVLVFMICLPLDFYPRSPCGERLAGLWIWRFVVSISIHALLAESDIIKSDFSDFLILFLSTLSLRRATIGTATALKTSRDFYPRSPCGERLHNGRVNLFGFQNFYPRSPCGERLRQNFECFKWIKFLSTLSLRRATAIYPSSTPPKEYFYPRSPCGERHAPSHSLYLRNKNFYPRSPCGERRGKRRSSQKEYQISIHALLAESDRVLIPRPGRKKYFYPRSPCGERRGND